MIRVDLQRDQINFLNEEVFPDYDLEQGMFEYGSVVIHRYLNYSDRVIIAALVEKEVIDVYGDYEDLIEIGLEWI